MFDYIDQQADFKFPEKLINFPCLLKDVSIDVNYIWLAEGIILWMEKIALRVWLEDMIMICL